GHRSRATGSEADAAPHSSSERPTGVLLTRSWFCRVAGGVWMQVDHASGVRLTPGAPGGFRATTTLAIDEGPVLADEQLQVRTLLVSEFEEDPLPFGIFELLAVSLEEPVRPALALD